MRPLTACASGLAGLAGLSGIALSFNYLPAPDHAWAALDWLQRTVPAGHFIRSLHVYASGLLIAVLHLSVVLDLVSQRYRGADRGPWWLGLGALVVGLGLGFTGSLLPWTQHAYWDAVVRLGIMEGAPGIGPTMRTLVQGGPTIGLLPLVRYFALHAHILGPLLLIILIWRARLECHPATPIHAHLGLPQRLMPHGAAMGGILIVIGLSLWQPAWLGPLADPTSSGYEARPEWWFLPLFQLRKFVQGPAEVLLLMLIPGLVLGYLAALPWLDATAHAKRRKVFTGLAVVGVLVYALLLGLGRMDRPAPPIPAEPPPPPGTIEELAETD